MENKENNKQMLIEELAKLELNKSDLKQILINNFFDGEFIDLSKLNLKNFKVNLSNMEAKKILNFFQSAEYINNSNQKAEEEIDNMQQTAKKQIDNSYHKAYVIKNVKQEGNIENE